jgi:hypothetical protein
MSEQQPVGIFSPQKEARPAEIVSGPEYFEPKQARLLNSESGLWFPDSFKTFVRWKEWKPPLSSNPGLFFVAAATQTPCGISRTLRDWEMLAVQPDQIQTMNRSGLMTLQAKGAARPRAHPFG